MFEDGHYYARRMRHVCQKDQALGLVAFPGKALSFLAAEYYLVLYEAHPYHLKNKSDVFSALSASQTLRAPLRFAPPLQKCQYAADQKGHIRFQTKRDGRDLFRPFYLIFLLALLPRQRAMPLRLAPDFSAFQYP